MYYYYVYELRGTTYYFYTITLELENEEILDRLERFGVIKWYEYAQCSNYRQLSTEEVKEIERKLWQEEWERTNGTCTMPPAFALCLE